MKGYRGIEKLKIKIKIKLICLEYSERKIFQKVIPRAEKW